MPPMRFGNVIKNYTDCLGMAYGFVLGHPADHGFRIDVEEVLRVIDMLETRSN